MVKSDWIDFVKSYAAKNNLKYKEALSKAGESYKTRNDPPKVAVTASSANGQRPEEVKEIKKGKKEKVEKKVEEKVEEVVKTKRQYNKKEKIEVKLGN